MNDTIDSITARHRAVESGRTTYQAGIETVLQRATEPAAEHVVTHVYASAAHAAARHADALLAAGVQRPVLAGLPVTVKDLRSEEHTSELQSR